MPKPKKYMIPHYDPTSDSVQSTINLNASYNRTKRRRSPSYLLEIVKTMGAWATALLGAAPEGVNSPLVDDLKEAQQVTRQFVDDHTRDHGQGRRK